MSVLVIFLASLFWMIKKDECYPTIPPSDQSLVLPIQSCWFCHLYDACMRHKCNGYWLQYAAPNMLSKSKTYQKKSQIPKTLKTRCS